MGIVFVNLQSPGGRSSGKQAVYTRRNLSENPGHRVKMLRKFRFPGIQSKKSNERLRSQKIHLPLNRKTY
jgi:hypothetical protein